MESKFSIRASDLPPAPRRVRLTTLAKGLICFFAVLVFAIDIVAAGVGVSRVGRLNDLMEHGRVIEARVLGSRQHTGKSTSFWMTVEFDVRGHIVSDEKQVPREIFSQYSEQQQVPVTLAPGQENDFEVGPVDQQRVDAANSEWTTSTGLLGFMVTASLIGIVWGCVIERRLLVSGEATDAVVSDVKVVKGKTTTVEVKYRYQASAREREGSARFGTDAIAQLQEGSTLAVLYANDRPDKSIAFAALTMSRLDLRN